MKLSKIGEFGLIDLLAKECPKTSKDVILGIGDDSAAIKVQNSKFKMQNGETNNYLLITTDTLFENVHFRRKGLSYWALGRKALAINISDIAAMGGVPCYLLITICVPPSIKVESIRELYKGINAVACKYNIAVVGGDTVRSPKELVVTITLIGKVEENNLIKRSGAKVGDIILATGCFGVAARDKYSVVKNYPPIRLEEAEIIARSGYCTSMIDSSDGLARSVTEMCRASRTGAVLYSNAIPASPQATLEQALFGGEEYELVFTAPANRVSALIGQVRKKEQTRISIVGQIVPKKEGISLIDENGRMKRLEKQGYDHFTV